MGVNHFAQLRVVFKTDAAGLGVLHLWDKEHRRVSGANVEPDPEGSLGDDFATNT